MIKKFSFLALAGLIFGCSTDNETELEKELQSGNDIIGLASPVKLNYDETTIFLLDYFENAGDIDSISLPENMKYTFDKENATIQVGEFNEDSPISVLSVMYAGIKYDIPVFKSGELPFKFDYESRNDKAGNVALKGNFNGWNAAATVLTKDDDSWTTQLILEPGLYEYLVVEDGREMLDPNNPDKKDNGQGGFNSTFRVGSETPVPHISTYGFLNDSIVIHYPSELND